MGFWRSVGSSHNAFTVESFVDELAHADGHGIPVTGDADVDELPVGQGGAGGRGQRPAAVEEELHRRHIAQFGRLPKYTVRT